ncbi:hypothetical protein D3C80_1597680 [compost metagenome]
MGGDGFHFRPQRREVEAIADHQRRHALFVRRFNQPRQAVLKGQQRVAEVRIHFDDGRRGLAQGRLRRWIYLARAQRAHAYQHPIEAVGVTFVALALGDHLGDRPGMVVGHAVVGQGAVGQVEHLVEAEVDARAHGGSPLAQDSWVRAPAGANWVLCSTSLSASSASSCTRCAGTPVAAPQ